MWELGWELLFENLVKCFKQRKAFGSFGTELLEEVSQAVAYRCYCFQKKVCCEFPEEETLIIRTLLSAGRLMEDLPKIPIERTYTDIMSEISDNRRRSSYSLYVREW